MIYNGATDLAIMQCGRDGRACVSKLVVQISLNVPKWLARAKPKWCAAMLRPSVRGTVAVGMGRRAKALCTALLSHTW